MALLYLITMEAAYKVKHVNIMIVSLIIIMIIIHNGKNSPGF